MVANVDPEQVDDPALQPHWRFLRDLVHTRLQAAPFLLYGQWLQPPALDVPEITVDFLVRGIYTPPDKEHVAQRRLPAVLASLWAAPDGRQALALANISAVALSRGLLVPGGCDAQGRPVADVHLYDPQKDTWHTLAPLPEPRCAYALAAIGEQAYLFGGWDGTRYTATAYRYDAATDRWETLANAPGPRGFGGAAAYGSQLYYIGGYDGERELATCETYDPAHNTWSTCPRMLQPRGGLGLAWVGTRLYAIGGGWQHYVGFNESYDPQNQRWQVVETPITGEWRHAGIATIGVKLYVVGGWNGDYLNRTYSFDVLPFQINIPIVIP